MGALTTHSFATSEIVTAATLNNVIGTNMAELNRRTQPAANYDSGPDVCSSTSYATLGTGGLSVTATVGVGCVVTLSTYLGGIGAGSSQFFMSFEMSGANTLAANDSNALIMSSIGQSSFVVPMFFLTPGSTTFTCKYRILAAPSSGSTSVGTRRLIVSTGTA